MNYNKNIVQNEFYQRKNEIFSDFCWQAIKIMIKSV